MCPELKHLVTNGSSVEHGEQTSISVATGHKALPPELMLVLQLDDRKTILLLDRRLIPVHAIDPPPSPDGDSVDKESLCPHMGSITHYMDFVVGSWPLNVCLMSRSTDLDVCVRTYGSSRLDW
ncbi:hypothetical protein EYF80_034363 [Liparis tanakae]|uniref:Uncharacterized protein n=1 Tax=Liparis tanakae TaxID=230148 RepID=A0A4Z2GRL1_9TELE|nr:hypothetical protein EYF80_034363 [Liparis tanakae]